MTETEQAHAWELRTLADAYTPREALRYIVADLFEEPSLSIVYGAPGCLKSMLMADMAMCVAAGLPWLRPARLPDELRPRREAEARSVERVPVLWIDFDNGVRRTDERMDALASSRGLDVGTPITYVSMPVPRLNCTDWSHITRLATLINSLGAKLVVIDNLGTVSGGAEENGAAMVEVMANLRYLSEQTGAAIVVIHHQRKMGQGSKARLGETLRGHSSIEASLDMALLVSRGTQEGERNQLVVICTKTRGVDVPNFGAEFMFTHRDGTKELETARFNGLWMATKAEKTNNAILDVVAETPGIGITALVRAAGRKTRSGRDYVRECVEWLTENERLRYEPGAKNSKRYYCVS